MRNEPTEKILELLKAWAKLCEEFSLIGSERSDSNPEIDEDDVNDKVDVDNQASDNPSSDSEEFEVERLLAVCYGDPNDVKKPGLHFKVCWLGSKLSKFFVSIPLRHPLYLYFICFLSLPCL